MGPFRTNWILGQLQTVNIFEPVPVKSIPLSLNKVSKVKQEETCTGDLLRNKVFDEKITKTNLAMVLLAWANRNHIGNIFETLAEDRGLLSGKTTQDDDNSS